jgi:CheY-like chemotaxis protein
VASEGPGRGSEFTVRLPLAPSLAQHAPVAETRPSVTGQRILVVDDNRDAAESLAMILKVKAREAGIDHYLVKPADIAALQALLASLR